MFRRIARDLSLTLLAVLFAGSAHARTAEDSTADHSKFESLQQAFDSGPAVTRACLECHTEAAKQVQETIHWTWEFDHPRSGQRLGKKHVVNNFCGNVASNEPRCTSCHAGYGWDGKSDFDFSDEARVDCLICHDRSGTYRKFPTAAGHPNSEDKKFGGKLWKAPDLSEVAQSVGLPGRDNCGACHFYGGGGDAVKHGDLDSSLVDPPVALDVHLSSEGADLVCADCHKGSGHHMPGSRYAATAKDEAGVGKPGERREVASCESCHGVAPHEADSLTGVRLNNHVERVACQSCHIPSFARGGKATKMLWDWSQAGVLDANGKPFKGHLDAAGQPQKGPDEQGHFTYVSKKGVFEYGENVVPEYDWFDGQVRYRLLGDSFDPATAPIAINPFGGGAEDPASRIWPFKVMRGRQAYDTQSNSFIYMNVFGNNDTAYWKNFDWARAIEAGMQAADVPYSGQFDFIDTRMYWPITHMVAPAKDAVDCADCHTRGADGRLAELSGVYLPGRDSSALLDNLGMLLLALSVLGVLGHAALRILFNRRES